MNRHIFISYVHEDGDFVDILSNKLKEAGFETWIDIALRAGEDWRAEIDQAIENSYALLVINTPQASTSPYVTYEWAFASGKGIKIIPIILKPTENIHPRLKVLQHLDFKDRKARPWDQLVDLLKITAREHEYISMSLSQNIPHPIQKAVEILNSFNVQHGHSVV